MKVLILGLLLSFFNVAHADTSHLEQVLQGAQRSAENKARDRFRHPEQTLKFFAVEDTMTVVEIWPGAGGWYTEILAPYLKDHGKFYAAHFAEDSEVPYFRKSWRQFVDKIHAQPDIYGKLELTALQPPKALQIAPNGTADRVLTFRNVHNWMKGGYADAVFTAMYRALKPGGILGVVEHRSQPDATLEQQIESGYVSEAAVIAFAEKAGFKLLDKTDINANSKDTKNYPEGVWTLPPTLRLGDMDKAKYQAIGESDRMTLKFIKPRADDR
ncbi:MAG: methyltransferase [Gammaproteobacteria bacterium HGW-Gammaproteobacteria-3]|nr:MAG: methyltransferase [Gammaproteobacteria bacterium HGW-Gammaproteobacteria-3]